jgi:hypothetical protein
MAMLFFLLSRQRTDTRYRLSWVSNLFYLHPERAIALRTRKHVPCHLLTVTNHGHTILLLFTQLLRKTSVIGRVKVGEGGSGDWGSEARTHFARFASRLFFFTPQTFFPPSEEKIQPGQRLTSYQLPTG